MEMRPTWAHAISIWWSYFWRLIGAIVICIVVSFLIVGVLGKLGLGSAVLKLAYGVTFVGTGIFASIIPVKMILGRNFRSYRIALVPPDKWRG